MSPDPIPIYQGQEFYVPRFEVKMGDRVLERDVVYDITSVTYKDSIDEIDSFEITINNWDADRRQFKYSDQTLFDPGKTAELWMGYHGLDRLRLMLTGEITSLRPTFPASGQPTLSISGLNRLHRLRREQVSRHYSRMTDSQIANQIGDRLNIEVIMDQAAEAQEKPHNYLLQYNQYDILFLMGRARAIGYDLFIEETGEEGQAEESVLYFGPSVNVRRMTYELEYGKSLIEFQPELTTANQVGEVVVRGWDAVAGRAIEATARRSELTTRGVGRAGGQEAIEQSFEQRREIVVDQPVNSRQEAETLARQTLERIAKHMVKGSGSTLGLPDLRAGNIIRLAGLGKRFSGRYFVTSTTHAIGDGGYTTRFECRREELED